MNLKSSFGQATPSHPPEAVTPLPCAEDLLDPAANALHAVIPALKLLQSVIPSAPPHADLNNVRKSALGYAGVVEVWYVGGGESGEGIIIP
jgi:hypothetical protein